MYKHFILLFLLPCDILMCQNKTSMKKKSVNFGVRFRKFSVISKFS